MIDLPFKMIPLDRWKVYKEPLPIGSDKEHRLIIIVNAETMEYLYITSKVEKVKLRARYDTTSVVELSTKDWPEELTKDCCIHCGKGGMQKIEKQQIKELYNNGKFKIIGTLPEAIQTKVKSSIRSSITFSPAEKKFYTL